MNSETLNTLDTYSKNKYKYGFVTDIDNEKPKKGLTEDTIKFISLKKNEPDWKIYHKAHHTSPSELAKIANQLKPKTLVLSHILFWGSTEEEVLKEISEYYSGDVILARDLIEIN